MSDPQTSYRIYRFNAARHIVTADVLKALGDEEAIANAEAAGFGSKMEIWDGSRLVAQLEGERRKPVSGMDRNRTLPTKSFLDSRSRNVPKPAALVGQWLTKMSSPSAPRPNNVAVSRKAHTTKRPR